MSFPILRMFLSRLCVLLAVSISAAPAYPLIYNIPTGETSNVSAITDSPTLGAIQLVKTGGGTLILDTSNTHTGGTVLQQGELRLGASRAIGPVDSTLTVTGNSVLRSTHTGTTLPRRVEQNIVINEGATLRMNVLNQFHCMEMHRALSGSGTLWVFGSDNDNGVADFQLGTVTFTGTIRIGDGTKNVSVVLPGLPDGPGAIELGGTSGTGQLTFLGLNADSFATRQVMLNGTTGGGVIRNLRTRAERTLTFQRDLVVAGVGNKSLSLGGTHIGNNAFNGLIPDGVGSIISFTKEGPGKWVLSKTANTYSGPTRIMEGELEVKKLDNGGSPSSIGQSGSGPKNLIFGPANSTLRYTGTGDRTDRNFILLGNTTLNSSGSGALAFDYHGIISPDVTGLVGKFYLGNPKIDDLASTADLMVGMAVTSDAFIGTKTITAINSSSSITLDSGTGIQFGTFGLTVGLVTNRTLTLAGTQTGANTISGILRDSSNYSSTSSPGVLSIIKQDAGTWRLDGLNTYTGATTINAGTLEVKTLANGAEPSSIGAATGPATNLILSNGTTLRCTGEGGSTDRSFTINGSSNGHQATIDSSGNGPVVFTSSASPAYGTTNQTRTLNLRGTNAGTNTFSANIANNGSGAVSITKHDSGTWILAGTNNYTGPTTINAGTLLVNGSLSASSAVTVNGNATLGGTGTYAGSLTLASSTNLSPGAPTTAALISNNILATTNASPSSSASIGTFSIGGNLNISAMASGTGKLQLDLGPIDASDQIAVGGTLSIGSLAFGFDDFTFTRHQGLQNGTYTLITSNSPINGTLDPSDLSGRIGNGGNGTLRISSSGTSIELVVVVPPFYIWSDDALFKDDANGDGVSNGLAFLLGAVKMNDDARGLLPIVTESGGDLMLAFKMLKASIRGTAALKIERTSDLNTWIEVAIPEASSGPIFNVSENAANPDLNDVTVTIPASEAVDDKLFARLKATQ